jgi:hypothetical protein
MNIRSCAVPASYNPSIGHIPEKGVHHRRRQRQKTYARLSKPAPRFDEPSRRSLLRASPPSRRRRPPFDVVVLGREISYPLIEARTSNTTIAPAFDGRALLRFITRHNPITHIWPCWRTPWRLRPKLTLGLDSRLQQGLRLGPGLSLGLTMWLRLGPGLSEPGPHDEVEPGSRMRQGNMSAASLKSARAEPDP